MSIVPDAWLSRCSMQGIVVHWTAGAHRAAEIDKEHYHIIIEFDGTLVRGDHAISDNVNTRDGDYAAHTLHCNTGWIGVSVCCMAGAIERPFNDGIAPMGEKQWETMAEVAADLCRFYKIPLTAKTVLGHGEVQGTLGIAQKGKWDPMVLPWAPGLTHAQVGDMFRANVRQFMTADEAGVKPPPVEPPPPLIGMYRVSTDGDTLNFRRTPGGEIKGELPNGTIVQRLDSADGWAEVKTPAGFVGWVAARYLVPA